MVIESFNFSEVEFYECGTYVKVFSFDLVFKKPLEKHDIKNLDIKMQTSAESTLAGIRYSSTYYAAGRHTYAPHCKNNIVRYLLEFNFSNGRINCDKSWNSVEIRTTNVKKRTCQDYEIPNVVCDKWYGIDKFTYNCEEGEGVDSLNIFVEIIYNSSMKAKLHKSLDALLISELFSDVVIVSSDGKNFNVHKNIISCNSEVFKAHFLHETKESTTGKIMSAFDSEVITELLGYMYSEQVNNMSSVSERLLAAADFYKIDDLKGQCELYLSKNITVDNAIDIYKLADLHLAPCLKKKCMRFIQIHSKEILESTAWAEFDHPVLMKELCDFLLQIN